MRKISAVFWSFFLRTLGQVPEPGEITIAQLRAYIAYLHECQYARSTIARRLACLRSFFSYCRREGLTEHNPAKALRTPRAGRKLPHFLTTEQVAKLLETPPANHADGLRDRAMLESMYSAGLRVAELVGLNVERLGPRCQHLARVGQRQEGTDCPRRQLCRPGVGSAGWKFAVPPPNAKPSDPAAMFLNRFGRRLDDRSVGRMIDKYRQTGLEHDHLTAHIAAQLRHASAGWRGRPAQRAGTAGPQSLTTTQIYTHVSTRRLRETYEQAHPHAAANRDL